MARLAGCATFLLGLSFSSSFLAVYLAAGLGQPYSPDPMLSLEKMVLISEESCLQRLRESEQSAIPTDVFWRQRYEGICRPQRLESESSESSDTSGSETSTNLQQTSSTQGNSD